MACGGAVIFGTAVNMTMATVGRALIGIGVGGVFVPGLKTFSKWYREKEFAGVTGIFLAAGNAGNLSASLPLTYVVLLLGWRTSFLAIGTVSFLLAMICWGIVRDKPEDKVWQPIAVADNPSVRASEDTIGTIRAHKRLFLVFSKPNFWMVTLSAFFWGGPSLTFQGLWSVPYLMDVYGHSRLQAGGLLMLIPTGFIIGAPSFGLLSDRLPLSRKGILICSLGLALSCWAILFLTRGKPPAPTLVPLFLIMGACGGGALSLYMTITKELFPPWLTGTAVGLMNPSAFLSAAMFQPFTGLLMDAVGRSGSIYSLQAYYHVFIAFFISMIIGIAMILPLSIPKKQPSGGAR
jgi:sugar phosphate permease